MREVTAAIVGGGAGGTLTGAMLVERSASASVAIIDPCDELGRGVAYSTDCPRHLLNVPAANMSARPENPDHFVRWLGANAGATYGPEAFVPRSLYGDYLCALARDARDAAPDRFTHVRARAIDVRPEGDRVRVSCSDGRTIRASALVLATGNAAPAASSGLSPDVEASHRYFRSAWEEGAIRPGSPNETVLLIGTGLTAVDAACGLRSSGHRGTIFMVSRRGLLAHDHRTFDASARAIPAARTVAELLDALRARVRDGEATGGDWRAVVDVVRPFANALWTSLSLEEQRRFFRHALPYWNAHRHRIPPDSAKEIAHLRASGTLRVVAGRVGAIAAKGDVLSVPIELRRGGTSTVDAARVIDCSGPQRDVRKLRDPMIENLLASGWMLPNPHGIGARVAASGALIGASGPSERLFAIGALRFGTLIETTAIPEIRVQALQLANTLARAFASDRERLAG